MKIVLWTMLPAALAAIIYVGLLQAAPEQRVVTVKIEPGENTAQIAGNLVEAGVISNAYTFKAYASITETEVRLQPGTFRLKTNSTYEDILKVLTRGRKKRYVQVLIPEGFTAGQIAERLAAKTKRPVADYLEFVRGQGVEKVRPPQVPAEVSTVEGYLFPKTYLFEKKEHPRKIVGRMIEQYQTEIKGIDWSFATQKNLTPHQIVTIASLIEKEAKVPEERPLMAAVIYNRLAKGMPLQIDATVQYALPERKEYLTNEDLKIASPYNTYQQIGLPPGPIASPGIDSIKAALAPAGVDYLYYVLTSPDGRHTFTNNYNEFLKAKRQAN